ncbi:DNA-binding response regulator [Gammaproteobacteria bacterium ESL0073]|nr:DNA-binding response regulator [Gammaproteobacteria bacterium ESL0073]
MKLLIVEDNQKMADYLKQGLTESGYIVDLLHNGIDGLHHALTEEYDLIILDIMLPKLDGLAILKTVRHAGKQMPILLLSARDQVSDRVQGLEMGADDYLVKPFDFTELLARIRTLLRRSTLNITDSDTLKIADLTLDIKRRYVMRGELRIDLTAKEFALLELLIRRQGEVLSRSLIASQVWDMNFDSDTNVIDVAMRRLRSKIDDNYDNKLIHTIRGMGYVLEDKQQ